MISPINLGFHIMGKQNSQPGASDRGGTGPLIACLRGPTAAPAVARAPLIPEVTTRRETVGHLDVVDVGHVALERKPANRSKALVSMHTSKQIQMEEVVGMGY